MSVLNALYNSYLYCEENGFVDQSDKIGYETVLLPIYHTNRTSNGNDIIEVTLDKNSEIISGKFLEKGEKIIFPVTEDSVSRSSGIAPHILSEEISYLMKEEKNKNDVYTKNLNDWIEFLREKKESNEFLEIIQRFLKKENFLRKIFESSYKTNFISLDNEKLRYLDSKKVERTLDIKKIMITFKVQNLFDNKDYNVSDYKDLHNLYIEYMLEKEKEKNKKTCNISGKTMYCSSKHRGLLGTSKLISVSNNEETYFGRIKKGEEITVIGYETSQKIHNMLKYFLENNKSYTYLGENSYLVNWFSDDIYNSENISITKDITDDIFGNTTLYEEKDISEIYNEGILKYLSGKHVKINENAKYYIMVVNKISNGRLSIKYFREFRKSDFFERISKWYEDISWTVGDKNRGEIKKFPGIYSIINYTYGIERNGKIELDAKGYRRDLLESFLSVMLDNKRIPMNMVKKMYSNVCNRQRYNETWRRLLEISCSVFKKYYIDYYKKEVSEEMFDNNDRDFLYGRLLAIFERVEEVTFNKDEKRNTNAQKLWNAYTNNPGKVMMVLTDKLQPYKRKLENSNRGIYIYLEKLTQDIMMKLLSTEDFENKKNKKLKENFIFGYYFQRNEFFKSNYN